MPSSPPLYLMKLTSHLLFPTMEQWRLAEQLPPAADGSGSEAQPQPASGCRCSGSGSEADHVRAFMSCGGQRWWCRGPATRVRLRNAAAGGSGAEAHARLCEAFTVSGGSEVRPLPFLLDDAVLPVSSIPPPALAMASGSVGQVPSHAWLARMALRPIPPACSPSCLLGRLSHPGS